MIVCQCNVITSRQVNFIESYRYPPILPPPPKAGRVARGTRDGRGVRASEVSQADYL